MVSTTTPTPPVTRVPQTDRRRQTSAPEEPVRIDDRRSCHKEQDLLLWRLRRIPAVGERTQLRHASEPERSIGRSTGCSGQSYDGDGLRGGHTDPHDELCPASPE